MKIIFLGTPEFAAESLKHILNSRHTVAAVVTQPDRINGRGNKVTFSPVKNLAIENGIPVFQFNGISKEGEEVLKEIGADIMVTAAYGQILRANILDICPKGVINVHASLLPKYRGSSPVQWAIINGEKTLGVTIMQTEIGIDTGDMILKSEMTPDGTENSAEMLEKLSVLGGELIVKALDLIEEGKATFTKQTESEATHCRMLKKEDGKIDFNKSAKEVVDFIRGMNPWPGAFTNCKHGTIKIIRAKECNGKGVAGTVVNADKKGLIVACKENCVEILRLKPENGKEMDATAFLLGRKLEAGSTIGE